MPMLTAPSRQPKGCFFPSPPETELCPAPGLHLIGCSLGLGTQHCGFFFFLFFSLSLICFSCCKEDQVKASLCLFASEWWAFLLVVQKRLSVEVFHWPTALSAKQGASLEVSVAFGVGEWEAGQRECICYSYTAGSSKTCEPLRVAILFIF